MLLLHMCQLRVLLVSVEGKPASASAGIAIRVAGAYDMTLIQPASNADLDEYLHPRCSTGTLDNFIIRREILAAITAQLPNLNGTLLDVGCGYMPYKSLLTSAPGRVGKYIGMDLADNIYLKDRVDLTWDGRTIPLPDASVDCALATEFFEHCPAAEAALREVARVLRSGGRLVVTVPFLWPLHEVPHDEYRYTPFSLARHLRAAGFGDIDIRPLGGWDACMAQMIGLWIRWRGFSDRNRAVLSRLAMPLVRSLYRRDRPPADFRNMSLMAGLAASAIKR